MNSSRGFIYLVFGTLFFITSVLAFFADPSYSYHIPLIFCALIIIIMAVFEFRVYYNKSLYRMLITLVLIAMWIILYIQSFYPSVNEILSYVGAGIITLFIFWTAYKFPKEMEKYQRVLEPYDKALAANPNNIATLNNKGVKLTGLGNHGKAMKCFNEILQLDPEDAAALHNKGVLMEKSANYRKSKEYLDKALELDPGLEKAKKAGKLTLESKKRKSTLKTD